MFIDLYISQHPNPVRGDMLASFVYMSPLQGLKDEV